MILDYGLKYSDEQAVTATAASTNVVDHFATTTDIGTGEPMYLVCSVDVAMTDAGSDSTITVTIEQSVDAAFTSPLTAQTIGTFAALSAAGTVLIAAIQPGQVTKRFTRVKYTTTNGNLTTGSFSAFLTSSYDLNVHYPDAITIS